MLDKGEEHGRTSGDKTQAVANLKRPVTVAVLNQNSVHKRDCLEVISNGLPSTFSFLAVAMEQHRQQQ